MSKKSFTATEIEAMVEEVISECGERGVSVESVEPYEDYFTVKFDNDVNLSTLNAIARKVGSKYMSVGSEDDRLSLFFKPGQSEDSDFDEDDDYQQSDEEDRTPQIPDDMRHTDRFPDAEDVVIPGTEQRVSNTEQCEQIVAWMKKTGRIPIVFIRLDDGVHVEVSDIFDRKAKAVLAEGHAIGADARRYTFEQPDHLAPIGGDICVRATCDETGRSDWYGLSFFVQKGCRLMSNKYKEIGSLGNVVRVRTQNTWIIAFPDGTESQFHNYRLAHLAAKAALSQNAEVKVYEETLMRFKKSGCVNDEKFRIDITDRTRLDDEY